MTSQNKAQDAFLNLKNEIYHSLLEKGIIDKTKENLKKHILNIVGKEQENEDSVNVTCKTNDELLKLKDDRLLQYGEELKRYELIIMKQEDQISHLKKMEKENKIRSHFEHMELEQFADIIFDLKDYKRK